jgi:hypothetical protein
MGRYSDHTIILWDIRTLTIDRDENGARSFDYGPTNTNPYVVDYVGHQGYHHLRLPQLSLGLGVILGNL